MTRKVLFVAAIGAVFSGTLPVVAQSYTEDQLTLASQLGAALALSNSCPTIEVPVAGIANALNDAGLSMSDVTETTAFSNKMKNAASNVNTFNQVRIEMGRSKSQIAQDACDNLIKNYGPEGITRPGIVGVD